MKKNRKAKSNDTCIAKTKDARSVEDNARTDHLTIVWKFKKIDWNGPWGHSACENFDYLSFITNTLSNWETMTWAQLYAASGGRSNGNNNHPIEVAFLSRRAQQRLREIYEHDIEEVVSLRISGCVRLYVIRDGRALEILWYDPWHCKQDQAVCPSKKRGT